MDNKYLNLGSLPKGDAGDTRQVLYWNPAVRLGQGGQERMVIHAPDYAGRFRIVAEGLAADGTPIHREWTFEVE